ncbi:hypothetical protein KCU62_g387, partial [Aureobasidium sp. EXF-3399]
MCSVILLLSLPTREASRSSNPQNSLNFPHQPIYCPNIQVLTTRKQSRGGAVVSTPDPLPTFFEFVRLLETHSFKGQEVVGSNPTHGVLVYSFPFLGALDITSCARQLLRTLRSSL